jgi:hypothetical protein
MAVNEDTLQVEVPRDYQIELKELAAKSNVGAIARLFAEALKGSTVTKLTQLSTCRS